MAEKEAPPGIAVPQTCLDKLRALEENAARARNDYLLYLAGLMDAFGANLKTHRIDYRSGAIVELGNGKS